MQSEAGESLAGEDADGPGDVFAAAAPRVDPAVASRALQEHYGLAAKLRPLAGERDENFLAETPAGERFVLKLFHPAEDPAIAALQAAALRHLAGADPGLPVPRLIPCRDGRDAMLVEGGDGSRRIGRLITFLDGRPIAGRPGSTAQAEALGGFAGRLGRALAGVAHPAALHPILWDLARAKSVRPMLTDVEAPGIRALAQAALDRFSGEVAGPMASLRRQLIHNDLNPHNILSEDGDAAALCGIIDFGDLVESALVNDVAIAASYVGAGEAGRIERIESFVGAYHRTMPLTEGELMLLPDLIATRHAMTIGIGAWRAKRHPGNRAYILRNRPSAVEGLEALAAIGREELQQRFLAACGA